ncbi:trihydrophobin-like [Sphaerodactylus townsendi]|uniref:Uncharacterized protein n=1 Tax=Sphaerodactylus townsendi TaxID=933632 RepID=A0ACB8FRQ5_9SAUR|nr:trihydrophobin-like [Sphaerodactylus townsendi]
MKFQLVAAFLAVCLLSLQGIRAAPNQGSFDDNNVGSNSFNDNGNNAYGGGNGGSFDGNTGGDNSFNNNGNNDGNPVVWY